MLMGDQCAAIAIDFRYEQQQNIRNIGQYLQQGKPKLSEHLEQQSFEVANYYRLYEVVRV